MGGVIGATSGKFVLMATSLLLHGRIDGMDVRVAIVPAAPTSALSTASAARIRARSRKPDATIGLRAESFQARLDMFEVASVPAPAVDIRIGQDLLDEHPIEIDFKHHEIQPLLPSEARRIERASIAIPVRREADGTLSVDLAMGGHATARAKLDLSSATGVTASGSAPTTVVNLGPVRLTGVEVTDGPGPVVGLYAFKSARVIFDLRHDRIWVRP